MSQRRNDNVGKAFICNLHTFEILLGSNKPLMSIIPWQYNYVDTSTTIFYLWKWAKFWKLGLDFTIPKIVQ